MDKHALDGLALLHDLVPFLAIDRLFALLNDRALPAEADGAALFADISGFTALTEELSAALGPERGAEELTQRINDIFSGIVNAASRYGGAVLRFSGDGLTAWFAGQNAAMRAVIAAIAMQAFMQAVMARYPTLRLKVAIGSGASRRFSPGDPAVGLYDVLAGPAVERMAHAAELAQADQIVLCPVTTAAIESAFAHTPLADGFNCLVPTILAPAGYDIGWPPIRWLDHVDRAWSLVEMCRPHLPAPIYERLRGGHGAYVADLRLVASLFVRFTGLDYTAPDAADRLDALVRVAQACIREHGGTLSEVGVGDKGSELVALFGAPTALENPPQRAASAAYALLRALPHVQTLHIGLTCGRLFTGTIGSPMRRAYAAIGDEVNLAARLMIQAEAGEVLANYRAYQMADGFTWEALPPIPVKGKVAPVRVYRLLEPTHVTRPLAATGRFVARAQELAALTWLAGAQEDGHARVLIMVGEPGTGKSHLLNRFAAILRERGITGLLGSGHSIDRQTPYHGWQDIFRAFFGLSKQDEAEASREQVLVRLSQIAPDLVDQAPLLNDVLQLDLPESDLTASMPPAERHARLVDLLVGLLRAWLAEDALALTLDNAQWLDTLSWDLLAQVAEQAADLPLSILVAMRPLEGDPPAGLRRLEDLARTHHLTLQPLSAEDSRLLAAEVLGVTHLPEPVVRFILQKTGGNPFFIREVTAVLRDSGVLEISGEKAILKGDLDNLPLPDTVQGIVRRRIDQLPPEQQTLLKVAAVLGPQFRFRTLQAIQPLRLSDRALRTHLDALESMDLHLVEDLTRDAIYEFRYAITRELAYSALSFSQRRQLHRAAAIWYEQEYRGNLAPHYALLAHHWRGAEVPEREGYYAYLAGMRAAAQYAGADAIAYLERALELTPAAQTSRRSQILLQLETLYYLSGAQARQAETLRLLEELAAGGNIALKAEVDIRQARLFERLLEPACCIAAATAAYDAAARAGDPALMGQSRVYHALGLIQLGRYEQATALLSRAHAPGDGSLEAYRLDALGVALSQLGRYDEAQAAYDQALLHANASGNRRAVGAILAHLADNDAAMGGIAAARERCRLALRIHETIGDRYAEAQTLGRLGLLALIDDDPEEARTMLDRGRDAFRRIHDLRGEVQLLRELGRLQCERDSLADAYQVLLEALDLSRRAGNPHLIVLSLLDLACAALALDNSAEANDLLVEASRLSATLDEASASSLAIARDALTAQAAIRQGKRVPAVEHVTRVLARLASARLETVPDAPWLCLTVYDVLDRLGQANRAQDIIRQAYMLLKARAARIPEARLRSRYLQSTPSFRRIAALAEAQTPGGRSTRR